MKLTVIGTGYVGLVSGVCFADLGHEVACVDKIAEKITRLEKGEVPIYEPGLDAILASRTKAGHLSFTTDLTAAMQSTEAVFIAVGTPPHPETGQADLKYVYAAAEEIATQLPSDRFVVVITKSTVPVGTNREVAEIIAKTNPDTDFAVCSNPEFLREGAAIEDFMKPDRIVVGVEDERAGTVMAKLYRPLTNRGFPLLQTDIETAEMIKYASNSFLATKIAFINEMADICEHVGANVELVAKGMGMDERIGDRFLRPGPGFGGSCFPKDAVALAHLAEQAGVSPKIVNTVIEYNLARRESMADKVIAACGGSVKGKVIAILGLTFKANTDDMRESPALSIIPKLIAAGANIQATDPEGIENARALLGDEHISYCKDAYAALTGAHAACIVTEWADYAGLDLPKMREVMHTPVLVDLRNLFHPDSVANQGFSYHSIGRQTTGKSCVSDAA